MSFLVAHNKVTFKPHYAMGYETDCSHPVWAVAGNRVAIACAEGGFVEPGGTVFCHGIQFVAVHGIGLECLAGRGDRHDSDGICAE